MLQHEWHREDGSRCHRQVEATTSTSQGEHQANEDRVLQKKTAWQNRSLFAEWLRQFDAKMHGRRVLLLLDNASCHDVALNATISSWHSCRQTWQHIYNRSTQVSLDKGSLTSNFSRVFSDELFGHLNRAIKRNLFDASWMQCTIES